MKKISANNTNFYKRVLPRVWFVMIGLVAFMTIPSMILENRNIYFVLSPVLLFFVGLVLFKLMVSGLMDEVHDDGNKLEIINDGKTEIVDYSNVEYISYRNMIMPQMVFVFFKEETLFGKNIKFSVKAASFSPFTKNENVLNLMDRIDKSNNNDH